MCFFFVVILFCCDECVFDVWIWNFNIDYCLCVSVGEVNIFINFVFIYGEENGILIFGVCWSWSVWMFCCFDVCCYCGIVFF